MTKDQQQAIIRMKNGGFTLTQIATRLGLSRNTVKSFCQRNQDNLMSKATGTCEQCGAVLFSKPGHKEPRFCSDKCRSGWWNRHPEMLSNGKMVESHCKCCDVAFRSYPSQHRDYCSRACYLKARYGGERDE